MINEKGINLEIEKSAKGKLVSCCLSIIISQESVGLEPPGKACQMKSKFESMSFEEMLLETKALANNRPATDMPWNEGLFSKLKKAKTEMDVFDIFGW
jgi:hypothetical protein